MPDTRHHTTNQLVILSGKGGTGKTCLSAAFAHLSHQTPDLSNAVFADADVDAANLKLVLKAELRETHNFWGGALAEIDPEKCTACGQCVLVCRYDALIQPEGSHSPYHVDQMACDGCAACFFICPQKAVSMKAQQAGLWYQSETPFGSLFHAELFPGNENSGKLVTLIKQKARLYAGDIKAPLLVIDGPPGIGCPVISACAGTEAGLIITEPSFSGLHDLKRVYGVLEHFRIPAMICINKADVFPEGARQINEFAVEQQIEVLGEIPFDHCISDSVCLGLPVTEAFPESRAAQAIVEIWKKTIAKVFDK
ncbi:MAG TPA: ATP-binding protein [Anaerolineaceae bacterium]|nr:ATP-binding protein [Anaerolineaceae bacterium]HPN52610.1 ATP-binding protein [Anaerolineaceae bacterium]